MKPVISIHELGKKYKLTHNSDSRYRSLRDELLSFPKRIFGAATHITDFWALEDVSFQVMPGERIGIIGKNGAGKSTLLKLLSRITEPSAGEIILRGKVASLLEVGTGFHPELTGKENVFLNGSILGMSRKEINRKFDEIIDFASVEKFLDTPVKRYSSGMYVRLAFAIAAHLEPDILIVDEVLAVGDAEFQKKCLRKLGTISRDEGRTVLFVSHNLATVQQLCDRVLTFEQGHLISDSPHVEQSISRYLGVGSDTIAQWQNDGSFHCQNINLISFSVFQNEEHMFPNGNICNDKKIFFKIDFLLNEAVLNFKIGISVFNENGQLIFMSDHTDIPADEQIRLSDGRNVLQASLGAHILNDGKYRVSLSASVDSEYWIIEERDDIHLWIEVYGSGKNVRFWQKVRPGIIAPLLEWNKVSD
jgi:lipopolysaccharide transport system ATP-binding protein